MKVERKRSGRTLPVKLGEGPANNRTFDGYSFGLEFFDRDGRHVRVILERHEGVRFAEFIREELERQRAAIAAGLPANARGGG